MDDTWHFAELLYHKVDLFTQTQTLEREANKFVIFVAVTNNQSFGVFVHGQRKHQLWLATTF